MSKFNSPVGKLERVFVTGKGYQAKAKPGRAAKDPKYQASVVVTKEVAAPFIKQINDYFAENREKWMKIADAQTIGYRNHSVPTGEKDPETDMPIYKEDGLIEFFASTNTTWPDGQERKIKISNAKGREVNLGDKRVGNGSEGRFSAIMRLYNVEGNFGVNLYLDGLQFKKFVEYIDGPEFDEIEGVEDDGLDDGMDALEESTPEAAAGVRL